MCLSYPETLPRRTDPSRRPRRRSFWPFVAILLAILTGMGGFMLGGRMEPAKVLDPIWLRAVLNRPLDTSPPGDGFWITGYYVDYDYGSLESVKLNASHMDQVIIFGYGFDAAGNVTGKDQEIIRGVTSAQKRILLFGNMGDSGFDADLAHAILTDPAVGEQAITSMVAKAQELGVAGIQIDFENIPVEDRDAYTAFLQALKERLAPIGMSLSVAAAAKTSDAATGWGGATDYAAVGQIVDQFYIMAYDEHWLGGEPGPVASLGWVERVIRYATGVIPAQKIVLGTPAYGYEWSVEPDMGTEMNGAYGPNRMGLRMAEFGAEIHWDPVAGENKAAFVTEDGERVAWYPDERSMEAKLRLAYQYNLKGIALWRVGLEPDEWWHRLGEFRLNPEK